MFDWDDQEIANILWGENREADDHIVPYPEDIDKKVLSDFGDNDQKALIREDSESKAAEERISTSKLYIDGSKRDKTDGLSASGAVVDSQLDLPSISASKTDDSGIAKKRQCDINPVTSGNHHEDKDLGDLVSNSWTSIGSFDDLDRIFSNDDLDGNTSLGSTDELWSSPKDLTSGAAKSSSVALGLTNWEFGVLGNTSANNEINSKYLHNKDPAVTTGCQKADVSPYPGRTIGRHVEQEEYAVQTTSLVEEKKGLGIKTAIDSHIAGENIASRSMSAEKVKWSKCESKHEQATDRITDSALLQDVYDTWPSAAANVPQFGRQCAKSTTQNHPDIVPVQQQLSQEFKRMAQQHYSTPYGSPYAYGNFASQYPVMRTLKPREDGNHSILSNSEASPGDVISLNKPFEANTKPTKMTPQEKIEKLRRRQQMRAMLAIQRQKQRLGHQASSGDHSLSRRSCQEATVRHIEKTDLDTDEILSTLPCYDPGSPNKGEDSSTISNVNDYSVEDTVLYQLQDIMSRLDMNIRMCIRDSLYRLAQNASQRHYANDTSTTKRSNTYEPDVAKEDTNSHERSAGNADVETETNHIDRAVAHLLFHRPLKLSVRHTDTLESPTSMKVSTQLETAPPRSLPVGLVAKSSENECNLSLYGSKSPLAFFDSHEEDVPDDLSRNEMTINPQMKQTMAEHAD